MARGGLGLRSARREQALPAHCNPRLSGLENVVARTLGADVGASVLEGFEGSSEIPHVLVDLPTSTLSRSANIDL